MLAWQVEVGCAERGRALVLVWNALQQVLSASTSQLRATNAELQATNSDMRAQFNQALDQLKGMEFLRWGGGWVGE
jgi:cell division protein FtsB